MAESLLLNNRYRLLTIIGEGGMATVYRAQDIVLGRTVAVKVLDERRADDEAFLARFYREAQAAANLDHPNIVGVYDIGQDGNRHYIVMEYVEGRDLKELILESAPFPIERALTIAIQVCTAVGAAHKTGLVHCDVKPQNILVAPDGRVKVTDFGIARALTSTPAVEGGDVWGTPDYLSPEQAAGKRLGPPSDVYSIGVVMYEMLTGRLPFEAESGLALALKHLRQEPAPVNELNPRVPPGLARIVHKVLAKEPSARYRTASQLAQILINYHRAGEAMTTVQRPVVVRREPQPVKLVPPSEERVGDYEEETEWEEERGWDWVAVVLGAVALVAVLGLAPLWTLVYNRYARLPPPTAPPPAVTLAGDEVLVPDVVGMDQEAARRLIEATGLQFMVIDEQHHETIPALAVISQVPTGGQPAKRGAVVEVIISQGQDLLVVPDLIGQAVEVVEPQLMDMGFAVERREEWSLMPIGTVLAQDPPANSVVSRGTTVILALSSGSRLPLEANLADEVLLVSCDLDRVEFRPGETVQLTLHWQALREMSEDYTVFVHLTQADGQLVSQQDIQPLGGAKPTTSWIPGEMVDDPYELAIPVGASPGIYWLKVGMYSQNTMKRLPVVEPGRARAERDSVLLGQIQIIP
ncbi:MAG TPA: Stk1 family PASTA domain-containing Ser/Thr kinase [Anaerolineae bacterium]|nr:Stk1 family PASTA domain-containing Ser/Thr kinase [Anaerolineae bacterium]